MSWTKGQNIKTCISVVKPPMMKNPKLNYDE